MPYVIYFVNPTTLDINFLNFYDNYKSASANLKNNAIEYIKSNRDAKEVIAITSELDLVDKPDGYYYLISNDYTDRISVYVKLTKTNKGFFINGTEPIIKELIFFSLSELSVPEYFNIDLLPQSAPICKKKMDPPPVIIYMDELKEKLKDRGLKE